MSATTIAPASSRRTLDWDRMWERFGISVVLLLVWFLAILFIPAFSNPDNFINVFRQSAFVGIAAVGMTMAIISGSFDLSVGSTLALAAWTAVVTAAATGSALIALLAAVLVGAIVGCVNGWLVTIVKIPAFVATLGMLFVVRGITFIITNGAASRYNGPEFIWWGNGNVLGIPVPFIIFLVCAAIGAAVLRYTALGRYIFALGSNATSARVAGVPTNLVTFLVFVIVGIFTGINAMVLGSRLYSAGPGLEPGFELNVIATVVLGGTRLAGGRGSMLGTVAAALLFTTLGNILNLLQIDAFVQRVAVGLVLLIALSIEGVRQRLAERLSRE